MDRVKLPNPLDPNEWDAKLAELENLQRPLKFSELVDMAHTSFELRVAFDTDYQMGMNRTAKVGY